MRESDMRLTPREKISRAVADMQKTMPFWAYLSLNMRVREVDALTKGQFKVPMESACVDTLGRFWFCPEFVEKLTLAQTRTLICHEVAHLAFAHPWNFGSRQKEIANIAMDCVVMDIAEGQGFERMPPPVLVNVYRHESTFRVCDRQVTVRDIDKKTYESIYDELYAQLKDKIVSVPMDVLGSGQSPDEGEGGQAGDPQKQEDSRQQWERNLVDAAL